MLEDRRREIHDKLRSLRESLPAEAADVRDAEEQSVDDFVQEVDFALMQMKSETLKQDRRGDPPAGGRHLRALRRSAPGDRRGAPQGAALRRPVPRLPGAGGERRARRSARRRPSSACSASWPNVPLRAGRPRLKEANLSDERTPDFESAGVHDVNLAEIPTELAILPLRDTILFPHAILPLAVARESSVALVQRGRQGAPGDRRRHPARPRGRRSGRERPVPASARSPTSTRCSSSPTARCGSWSRASTASASCRSPSTARS